MTMPEIPAETEPASPPAAGLEPASLEKKPYRALSKLRRELSEEEFASPAVQRMLLERIEQLEFELTTEKPFRDLYHKVNTERAVLLEKLKVRIANDVVFGVTLSVASVLFGVVPALWDKAPYGTLAMRLGIALMIGAVISRLITWKK
jgi:hypothetical protein